MYTQYISMCDDDEIIRAPSLPPPIHCSSLPRAVFNDIRLQIVAVILCSTGVALLAYMDAGITNKKKTMTGVLLAALAAAGSAVYKVSRRRRGLIRQSQRK